MEIKTIGLNSQILSKDGLNEDFKSGNSNRFSLFFNDALNKVNELQLNSDAYKKLLITGEVDNLHDVTIAAEKANISLQLTLGIRNKVVEAYREIMRMQI
ncbi:flagellar hook-basal body complex protein FliE [Clostridium sp. Cult1]|jgi:flagellar hook-basal body complex protein FliE|uniref:flagellar hook-basal body complex protein FliE n=1 Tax=Clostridium sp. Cult1 TaxID=2079002 RepID=UPI001F017B35|nr:flagellar hook-basal body complex protein FliE [Clostridium sp. Cult1]MCF6463343.1 flagellar hook-basal body complex protein FliE [Clostridium sp. Cult1]